MAYVNVADWKPDQVTDWLKGLDNSVNVYMQSFLNNHVTGQQLLNLGPDDLEHLGIHKIGIQEIILEAVEHLRNIHYELDRENLQLLGMRLSCLAHSLHNELQHSDPDSQRLCPQILADIANIVSAVKPLIAWLDRPGFQGEGEYVEMRRGVLEVALSMATCGQRDRFADNPTHQMREASVQLATLADHIVREIQDPLILQPASLDLATLRNRPSDHDLGFYIVPSSRRVHQISELKLNSAAHQSGKIEPGDEIIQINYQTVVGWEVKHVMGLLREWPNEVLLTLKKRPRHTKVYGQIYVKPYRLPSKKRSPNPFSTRHLNLAPLRIHLQPLDKYMLGGWVGRKSVEGAARESEEKRESRLSSGSEEEVTVEHHNLALGLGVTSNPGVHRRATITGASPLTRRPPLDITELWHDLKLEKESGSKKSTSSVIDFEERLNSSSFVKDEPVTMETKRLSGGVVESGKGATAESAKPGVVEHFEGLSIKQRIKIFSTCTEEEETRPRPLNRPLRTLREEKATSPSTTSLPQVSKMEVSNEDDERVKVIVGQGCNLSSPPHREETSSRLSIEIPEGGAGSTEPLRSKPVIIEERAVVKERLDIPINGGHRVDSRPLLNNRHQPFSTVSVKIQAPVLLPSVSRESIPEAEPLSRKPPEMSSVSIRNDLTESQPDDAGGVEGRAAVSYLSKEPNDCGRCGEGEGEGEHTRIVQTINRHLLDDLGDSTYLLGDSACLLGDSACLLGDSACLLGGSLPRQRRGIALLDTTPHLLTHSLPLLTTNSHHPDLSTTISQVCGGAAYDYGLPMWQCTDRPAQASLLAPHRPARTDECSTTTDQRSSTTDLRSGESPSRGSSLLDLRASPHRGSSSDLYEPSGSASAGGPPLPPPRPSLSKPPSACYRAIIAARSLGKASPKAQRKKNPLLAKGRKVSVKELSRGEVEGWLQQRCRKGPSSWKRRWCLIVSNTLYTFVSRQGERAETMVCLPGFTVSPADEVKSRSFAFKVYHDGTSFYFAADSYMEFSYWLDAITVATLAQSAHSREIAFSESEGEEEVKGAPVPAPRQQPQPSPPTSSSHLAPASSSTLPPHTVPVSHTFLPTDLPKKFGSLKKLAYRGSGSKESDRSSGAGKDKKEEKEKRSGSSLDRKCRKLLGVVTSSQRPLPTSQYRSYRRVHNTPPPPPTR